MSAFKAAKATSGGMRKDRQSILLFGATKRTSCMDIWESSDPPKAFSTRCWTSVCMSNSKISLNKKVRHVLSTGRQHGENLQQCYGAQKKGAGTCKGTEVMYRKSTRRSSPYQPEFRLCAGSSSTAQEAAGPPSQLCQMPRGMHQGIQWLMRAGS